MRLGIALPNMGPLADKGLIREAVLRAEDSALTDIWVGDHVAYPTTLTLPRPEYPAFSMPAHAPILDPLAVLAYSAALTTRLQLGTSVLIVGYRNPVLTARMVQSIDHLSGGRLICGAAAGWMAAEFETLGGDFANRGAIATEYLALMRRLWSEDAVSSPGPHYPVDSLTLNPRTPTPTPIWIGGNSAAALSRVVAVGDGWQPTAPPVEQLAEQVDKLRARLDAAGRDGAACVVSVRLIWGGAASAQTTGPAGLPADPDGLLDVLAAYAAAGTDHVLLTLRSSTPPEYLALLESACTSVVPYLPTGEIAA
jgi:probable F420-dependent oxidoreductase